MRCGPTNARRMSCTAAKVGGQDWTLGGLLDAYEAEYANDRAKGDQWWTSAPNPEEALVRAFYDWEDGAGPSRRALNSHQHRIGYDAIRTAAASASHYLSDLMLAEDFDLLQAAFQRIWRTENLFVDAELLTYDVAERFGRYRGKYPQKVYLHAGAKAGAKTLGVHGKIVEAERFGPLIGRLSPSEIENFLCVCKASLTRKMLVA